MLTLINPKLPKATFLTFSPLGFILILAIIPFCLPIVTKCFCITGHSQTFNYKDTTLIYLFWVLFSAEFSNSRVALPQEGKKASWTKSLASFPFAFHNLLTCSRGAEKSVWWMDVVDGYDNWLMPSLSLVRTCHSFQSWQSELCVAWRVIPCSGFAHCYQQYQGHIHFPSRKSGTLFCVV